MSLLLNGLADLMSRLFDLLLAPFGGAAAWGMVFVSALAGVLLLLLFKVVTPQGSLARARRRLTGHIYELGLYRDDLGVLLRIQRDLAWANLRYLAATAPSLLIFAIPVALILAQVDARWDRRPLLPQETALVTVAVPPASPQLLDELSLSAPAGLRVEAAPVRDHAAGTITWRVRALTAGDHEILAQVGPRSWAKRLPAAAGPDRLGLPRLAATRERAGWHRAMLNPGEAPLPADSPLVSITVDLPRRHTRYLGVGLSWLAAFCVFSLLAGLAVKDRFRVEM